MKKNLAVLAMACGFVFSSMTASASEHSLKHHPRLQAAYHAIERAKEHYNQGRHHEAKRELSDAGRDLDAANNGRAGFGGHRAAAREDVRRAEHEIDRNASHFEVEKLLHHAKEETDRASEYADEHRG